MSKMIKIKMKYIINYTLILLTIFALGAITFMAKEANARTVAYDNGFRLRTDFIEDDSSMPVYNPIPVVDSISPRSANLGSGAKTVTITGDGFIPRSVARWNGSSRPTTFIDGSHLLIHLNASDMYGANGRYVNVWNPAPDGGYSNSIFFTINGYVAPNGNASIKNNTANNSNTGTVNGISDTNTDEPVTDSNYSDLAGNVIYGANGFMPSGLVQWLLFAIFILLVVILVRKVFWVDKYHQTPLKHA